MSKIYAETIRFGLKPRLGFAFAPLATGIFSARFLPRRSEIERRPSPVLLLGIALETFAISSGHTTAVAAGEGPNFVN